MFCEGAEHYQLTHTGPSFSHAFGARVSSLRVPRRRRPRRDPGLGSEPGCRGGGTGRLPTDQLLQLLGVDGVGRVRFGVVLELLCVKEQGVAPLSSSVSRAPTGPRHAGVLRRNSLPGTGASHRRSQPRQTKMARTVQVVYTERASLGRTPAQAVGIAASSLMRGGKTNLTGSAPASSAARDRAPTPGAAVSSAPITSFQKRTGSSSCGSSESQANGWSPASAARHSAKSEVFPHPVGALSKVSVRWNPSRK